MAVSKAMLSKSDAKILRDAALGVDAPQEELQTVISEIACNIHGFYILKSSQDDPFRFFLLPPPFTIKEREEKFDVVDDPQDAIEIFIAKPICIADYYIGLAEML